MIGRRKIRGFSRYAGPQTLAVLSCALALLTVNPGGVRGAQAAPVALTRVQGPQPEWTPAILEDAVADAVTPPSAPCKLRARKSKVAANAVHSGHSAFLQTVAMFNAALASHFAPLSPPAVLSIGLNDLTIQSVALVDANAFPESDPLPQPHERAFALTHCLLAPPA